jgi:hypothetical protein
METRRAGLRRARLRRSGVHTRIQILDDFIRGASPLGLPCTLSRATRRAPGCADVIDRCRSVRVPRSRRSLARQRDALRSQLPSAGATDPAERTSRDSEAAEAEQDRSRPPFTRETARPAPSGALVQRAARNAETLRRARDVLLRGASPLGLPCTLSRATRRAPGCADLRDRCRSVRVARSRCSLPRRVGRVALLRGASPLGLPCTLSRATRRAPGCADLRDRCRSVRVARSRCSLARRVAARRFSRETARPAPSGADTACCAECRDAAPRAGRCCPLHRARAGCAATRRP